MERRRFLRLVGAAGVAGTAVLTGCTGGNGTEDGTEDGTADGTEDGTENGDDGDSDGSGDDADDGIPENADVVAGPEGAWRFEPEEIEVNVGDTVVWYFASRGHNVTSHPDADPKCENPEGAEPFKSYEGDNHMSVNDVESTFSHTFETPGEYTYVCVPHSTQMVGQVTVTES